MVYLDGAITPKLSAALLPATSCATCVIRALAASGLCQLSWAG
jgi:hypothetical protein